MGKNTNRQTSLAIDYWQNKIIPALETELIKIYAAGKTMRFFHTKTHGLVRANFRINPDLQENLQVGIFAEQKTYPAWIRFSTASHTVKSDKKKHTIGMAIKLMDIPGKKLLENEADAETQDFLLVNAPVLNAKSFRNVAQVILAGVGNIFRKLWFAITHIGELIRAMKPSTYTNIIHNQFWSLTPSMFGEDRVVKYSVIPRDTRDPDVLHHDDDDYLRKQLSVELSENDAWFDFAVQFREDPGTMPLDDPSVSWNSEFHKLASIHIPKQEFDTEEIRAFAENLAFTPWHGIEAHTPVGDINVARKKVYSTLSEFRHKRNGVEYKDPTSTTQP
jgi:hypothetical protein